MIDLSVIVVNWNTRELLRACLTSIYRTIATASFEILVVDNASSDGSCEMVGAEFPNVRLARNVSNVGFARANNQALAVAEGRYLLLLNSDAELLPGTAENMLALLAGRPTAGIVGGQLFNPDGTFQSSFADFPTIFGEMLLATRLSRFLRPATYPSYPPEESQADRLVDWVSGACLMVRRTALDEVGGLDEDYFMYSEETDWCYRMRRKGWFVYYRASAHAIHGGSQSARRVPERRRSQVYRSKWLFMRKHHGERVANAFRSLLWTTSAMKLVLWSIRVSRSATNERAYAAEQVRSYRIVLNELRRAHA